MKYFTRLLLSLSFFLFNYTAFAQVENYLPATILDYKKNTIEGFVNFKDWRTNPTRIEFRETLEGTDKVYLPKDIKSFTVAGNQYFSQNVIIEASNVRTMAKVDNLNELAYAEAVSREPVWDTIHTFLELLIEGEKSLYLYRDGKFRSHLFIDNNGRYELLYYFIELNDAEKQLEANLNLTIVEHKNYQDQLRGYLKDCSNLEALIDNVGYTRKDITDIFKAYYDCKDQKVTFEKSVADDKVIITVLGGVNLMDLVTIGAPNYEGTYKHLAHGTHSDKNLITGGVGFDMVLPGHFGRHIFLNEILYKGLNLQGSWEQEPSQFSQTVRIREFDLKMSFVKWNMQYRHKREISPSTSVFFNFGIAHNFAMVHKNEMLETTILGSSSTTLYENVTLNNLQKYHLGLTGGLGIAYKKLSAEFRYEMGDDISELTIITSSSRNYGVLLGYRLN